MNEDKLFEASDPFSTALMKMKLRAFTDVALDAGGNWAIDFSAFGGFTLNVVQKGECWMSIVGEPQKIHLRAGDCFLLNGGRTFTLATNLSLKKRFRAEELFPYARDGVVTVNGGGDFFIIGTIFRFEGHLPSNLLGRLPAVIHLDGTSDQAAVLRWSLERFTAEMRGSDVGRLLILSHLAPIVLLQTLRVYLSSCPNEENWLVALSHPRLSRVFEAIQCDYKRGWSLEEFAGLANMSRSGVCAPVQEKGRSLAYGVHNELADADRL